MGKWLFNSLFPEDNVTYKEKLIECVNKQMSGHQIAKNLGVDYTCVHRWLRKLGLNLPNYHNELKFDNTVFDTIDNEEKAYWLGFMYADGYISSTNNSVELSLKGEDFDHLEKFRKFLNYDTVIKKSKSKCGKKEFSRCRLTMTNKHFHNSLINKGCVPNKSLILTFPNLSIFSSTDLIKHFIRGYVDGDGSVVIASTGYSRFEIVGTKEFLAGIKEQFPGVFSKSYYKDKRKLCSNTYFLSISGKKAAKFGNALYKDATIYLQRKYNKFIENKYDERRHFERMHTFSEKKQLCYTRATNRLR